MSSVQLSKFSGDNGIFKKFDKDNNGLDKKELNLAAQDAIKNKDYNTGSLLGTMAAGGKDNKGLTHDPNGDGRISQDELKQFAGLAGKKDEIDVADFSAGFGDAAKENNFFSMLDSAQASEGTKASEGGEEASGECEDCGGGGSEGAGGAESSKPSSAAGQAGGGAPAGGGGESGGAAPAGGADAAKQPQGVEQIMQMIMQLLQVLIQQMGGEPGKEGQTPGATGAAAGTPSAAAGTTATAQAAPAAATALKVPVFA